MDNYAANLCNLVAQTFLAYGWTHYHVELITKLLDNPLHNAILMV
jgi:hypothetical protein